MVRFASKRDKREGVCEHLCAGDPGHGGAVATTTGKDPGPSAGVAVGAKRPLEKGWRTFLPTPDHEGILASVHQKSFLDTLTLITAEGGKKGTKCSRPFRFDPE
jgi:hypothetical protein